MLRIERLSRRRAGDAAAARRRPAARPRDARRRLRARPRALRDALREAVAAQLVVADDEGRYAFRHALLREVVVDDLLPGERAELHLALARGAGAARRGAARARRRAPRRPASPTTTSPSGDQPAALAARVRAAEAAEAVHANGEAAALYSRALQLWDRVADAEAAGRRATTSSCCARAARRTGREHEPRRAESSCAPRCTSSATRDRVRAAELLELDARAMQFNRGDSADAAETRRGRSSCCPDEPSTERARLLASRRKELMLESRHDEARRGRRRRRWRSPAPSATRSPRCARWTRWASSLFGARPLRGGRRGAARGARLPARRRRGRPLRVLARQPRRRAAARRPPARGARGRRRGRELAAERRAPRRWLMLLRSELAFEAGDWDAAEEALPVAPARPAMGTTSSTTRCGGSSSRSAAATHDAARQLLDEARDVAADTREPQWIGAAAARCAPSSSAATGDLEAARAARRRRAGPARLLLAGRRADGARGRHRRARRGRRRRCAPATSARTRRSRSRARATR